MRAILSAGLLGSLLLASALAQPAPLDPAFGTDGRVTVQVGTGSSEVGNAVALMVDGRAVVAGETTDADGQPALALVRVLPDGRPDPAFGRDGRVAFSADATFRNVNDVAVQPDGRIVVAGTALDVSRSELRAVVLRFTADGRPDATFGDGGVVTLYDAYGAATALAIDGAGRVVVAGTAAATDNTYDLRIARLLSSGARDAGFAVGGVLALSFGTDTIESVEAITVDATGRIVGAGTVRPATGGSDMAAVRLTADGSLDASFGEGGFARAGWGASVFANGSDMQLDDAGRIVVAGSRGDDIAATRFAADGALDATFGQGGRATFPRAGVRTQANAVALDASGRIVLAGTETTHTVGEDITVLRLTAAGTLDGTFGTGGRVTLDLDSPFDYGYALALRPDGRPLVAGASQQPSANGNGWQFDVALVQFGTTGGLDAGFGDGGVALVGGVGPGPSTAVAAFALADGRTLLAGQAEVNAEPRFAAVRLLPDGTPDPAFGADGRATIAFDGLPFARSAALQPDGGLVVAGTVFSLDEGTPTRFAVARVLPDGAPDPAFGNGGRTTVAFAEDVELGGVHALADGRLVLVGTIGDDLALARLLPDGGLDPAFGTGGRRVVATGAELRAVALAADADGRLVVVAERHDGSTDPMVAVRLLPDGALDTSFGAGGVATVAFGADAAEVAAVAVRPDGRVVMAGRAGAGEARGFAVAQLTTSGVPDAAFGDGGRVRLDVGPYGGAAAVALDADGRVVLAGDRDGQGGSEVVVARLTASGQTDASFGASGAAVIPGAPTVVRALVLDAQGRPVVAGATFGDGPEALTALRLLPDGVVAGESVPVAVGITLAASPNPSRGDATVTLRLAAPGAVRVEVLDALGRRVAQLHDGTLAGGTHAFALGGARLPAGVYVVRAAAPGGAVALPVVVAR